VGVVLGGWGGGGVVGGGGLFLHPALWIACTEDGTIVAYNPEINDNAVIMIDNSAGGTSVYKSIYIGVCCCDALSSSSSSSCSKSSSSSSSVVCSKSSSSSSSSSEKCADVCNTEVCPKNKCGDKKTPCCYLYVTNFRSGLVEQYDSTWTLVRTFTDPDLPTETPPGFSPFGVYVHNRRVYVSFAFQDEELFDTVNFCGGGFIDVFDCDGVFIRRIITGGCLNAPYYMEIRSNDPDYLLVGNFGDGKVVSVPLETKPCKNAECCVIYSCIPGLYGGVVLKDNLIVAGGINDEQHGVVTRITLPEPH